MGKKWKKRIAIFLTLAMILSTFGIYGGRVRADVPDILATSTDAEMMQPDPEEPAGEVTAEVGETTEEPGEPAPESHIIRSFPEKEGEPDFDGTGAEAFGNEYDDVSGMFVLEPREEDLVEASGDILPGYADFTNYLRSHRIYVDGAELSSGATIKPDEEFQLKIDFSLSIVDMAAGGLDYYFPLPDHISIGDKGSAEEPITLYNANRVAIGTYFIKDDVLYVSFPGYYDTVIAYFELAGSWDGTENRSSIDVVWPDGTDHYKIDLCDLSVQKTQRAYVSQKDGSLKTSFAVTTRPKRENATISDITFTDTFANSDKNKVVEDTYGEDKAIKLSIYNKDKSLKETRFYKLSDVKQTSSSGTRLVIPGLSIEDGGYFVVEYEALISLEDRLVIDGTQQSDSYTNTAVSSYDFYDTAQGRNVTLSARAQVEGAYRGGSQWILKSASDDTKTKYTGGENKVVVPYIITINRSRPYSMGGSAVKDEITGFVGGDVVYDTSSTAETYVEWITNKGQGTVEQKWVILDSDVLEEMKGLCAKSADTALEKLRGNTALVNKLVSAINAAYGTGYTDFNDEVALTYVFTDEDSHNFVWIMPFDTEPTSYTIHYDTIVDSGVGDFKNAAGLWYTEYEGAPAPGGGVGWTRPVKKVMNATKSNAGVYIGSDGNYYVDYTLTVGVEAGSAGFVDVAVRDIFPYHPVTLDDGNVYNVFDWLAGFDADDVDISTITTEENIALVSSVVSITTDSTDPAVRSVLDTAYSAFFYEVSGDTDAANFKTHSGYPWNHNSFYQTTAWNGRPTGGTYYGKATPAGQFVVKQDMYNSGGSYLRNRKGGTFSPGGLLVWLGDIPGTEEGYDYVIRFTMQINPMLVEKLPDLLESEGRDFITNTNIGEVWTSFVRGTNESPKMNFRTNTRLQNMPSPYWLGIQDDHPGVEKTVVGPSGDNKYVTYEVTADPGKNIDAENSTYELTDMLNITGMQYRPHSFVIRDNDGAVVWSDKSGVTPASQYAGYSSFITLSVETNERESNGFVFSFDNATGKFTDANGKFMILRVEYDVEMGDLPTDTTIQNTAGLFELAVDASDGQGKRKSLGEATVEYAIDKALDKHISEAPSAANQYTASYFIDINPTSENAARVERTTNPDGSVTETERPYQVGDVLELRDVLSDNQSLVPSSIKVYKYQGVQFTGGTDISDLCDSSYDADTHVLRVDVTIDDLAYRYRVIYDATIDGASNTLVYFRNEATMDNSTAKLESVSERVLVYEYSGGSEAYVNRIDFHKYDKYDLTKNLEAAFDLYKLEGNTWTLITTGTPNYPRIKTDATGYATIKNEVVNAEPILWVEDETYYMLVEVESPDGYVMDPTPIYYYVSKTGEMPLSNTIPSRVPKDRLKLIKLKNEMDPDSVIPVIDITNQNFGLDIQKVDAATGKSLPGAGFTIYTDDECTQKLAEAEDGHSVSAKGNAVYDSLEDGVVTFRDLEVPETTRYLYMKETTVPAGYKDTGDIISLTLQDNRVVQAVSRQSGVLTVDNSGRLSMIRLSNENKNGRLEISKTVTNADADHLDRTFTFSAKIMNPDHSLYAAPLPFVKTDGEGNTTTGTYSSGSVFYLKHNETMMISGIPDGCLYTVKEVKDSDFSTSVRVTDSARTDSQTLSRGYEVNGSVEDGAIDSVAYTNDARVSVDVTKAARTAGGEALSLPDGLTLQVLSGSNVMAEAVYSEERQEFYLSSASDVDIQLTPHENGFRMTGLPYSAAYKLAELNADMDGKLAVLSNDIGATVNINWFEFHPNTNIARGNGEVDNEVEIQLTNTYTETEAEAEMEAYKDYNMTIPDGKFTIQMYAANSTSQSNRVLIAEADVDSTGKATFPVQKFAAAGYYYYQFLEKLPEGVSSYGRKDGITYDRTMYACRIHVERNSDTGELEVTQKIYYRGSTSIPEIRFANSYSATGNVTLRARKSYNKSISSRQFSFNLQEYTDDTFETVKRNAAGNQTVNQTVSNYGLYTAGTKPLMSFNMISYTQADIGMHYYLIKEVLPGSVNSSNPVLSGIRYDTEPQKVFVNVEDNEDGTLKVTVTDEQGDEIEDHTVDFINTYEATGSVTFEGEKRLENHSMEAGEFTFEIKEYTSSARTEELLDDSGAPVVFTATHPAAPAEDDGTGKRVAVAEINFPEITYNFEDVGTHYYRVTERIPGRAVNNKADGITYTTTSYDVTVTVRDGGSGTLYTTTSGNARSLDFINTYSATGTLDLSGTKTLQGRGLHNGEFTYLVDMNGETGLVGSAGEDGTILFANHVYTENDIGKTYTYEIYEYAPQDVSAGKRPGVTYDPERYTVTVEIGEGSGGNLDIRKTVKDSAGKTVTSLDFINEYDAEAAVTFTADKLLLGRDMADAATPGFEFVILEGTEVKATGRNNADGQIEFTPIRFYIDGSRDSVDQYVGAHTYTIREVKPDPVPAGYTYDDTEYTVTVTATDREDGTLDIAVTGADLSDTGLSYQVTKPDTADAVFINSYEARGTFTFEGNKSLEGRTLDDGEFTFLVEELKYDAAEDDYIATGRTFNGVSDDAGVITYEEMEYVKNKDQDDTGLYRYSIREVVPDEPLGGVTYDDILYEIGLMVTDESGDSILTVYPEIGADAVDFINTYEAEATLTITATKLAETDGGAAYHDETSDGTAVGNTFTFEAYEILADGSEDFKTDVVVGVDETADMPAIVYSLADLGIHQYRIIEKQEDAPGYTYSSLEKFVTVKAVDGREGILLLYMVEGLADDIETDPDLLEENTVVFDSGDAADAVEATNIYAAEGEAVLSVQKIVENMDDSVIAAQMEKDMFFFTLSVYDAETGEFAKISTLGCDEEGNVVFDPLSYTMGDLGVHLYRISEEKEEQQRNILYEAADIYPVVTVTNNGDGTLTADVVYAAEDEEDALLAGNGTVVDPEMVNRMTEVRIEKQDPDGNILPGARLTLFDENGKGIYSFTSTDAPEVLYGLDRNVVYTLRELTAPDGYDVAEDVRFQLNDAGEILLIIEDKEIPADTVVMTDAMIKTKSTGCATNTGDGFSADLMMLLMLLSAAGMLVLMAEKRKSQNKEMK